MHDFQISCILHEYPEKIGYISKKYESILQKYESPKSDPNRTPKFDAPKLKIYQPGQNPYFCIPQRHRKGTTSPPNLPYVDIERFY